MQATSQQAHSGDRFIGLLSHHQSLSPSLSPSSASFPFLRPHSPPWLLSDSPTTPVSMPSHPPFLFRPIMHSTEPLSPLPFPDIDSFLQHELSAPLPSHTGAVLSEELRECDNDMVTDLSVSTRRRGRERRRGSDCSNMSTSSSPNSALALSRHSSPLTSHPSSVSSASSSASSTSSPHHSDTPFTLQPSSSVVSEVASSSTSTPYGKLSTNRKGRRSLQLDPAFHALPRGLRRKHGASCHMCKTTRPIGELLVCTAKAELGKRKRGCRKKYCEFCLLRCHNIDVARLTAADRDCWTCPACHSLCYCAACQRYEKQRAAEQAALSSTTAVAAAFVTPAANPTVTPPPRPARPYFSLRVNTASPSASSFPDMTFQPSPPPTPLTTLHSPLLPNLPSAAPPLPPRPSPALTAPAARVTATAPQRPPALHIPQSSPSDAGMNNSLFSPVGGAGRAMDVKCESSSRSGSPFVPLFVSRPSPQPYFNFPSIFPAPQLFTAPPHCSSARTYSWSEIQG